MSRRTNRRLSAWQIFRAPLAIALAAIAGLLAGLLGEGWWDVAANLLLAVTILTLAGLRLTGRG